MKPCILLRQSLNHFPLFQSQACEHLKIFIDDCDRRTELAKKRLLETQEELSAEVTSKAEKVRAFFPIRVRDYQYTAGATRSDMRFCLFPV